MSLDSKADSGCMIGPFVKRGPAGSWHGLCSMPPRDRASEGGGGNLSGTRSAWGGAGLTQDRAPARALQPGRLWPILLLAGYVAAFAAWEFVTGIRSPLENILANLGGLVPGVAATAIAWGAARDPRLVVPLRRAWRWIAWSLAVFWMGDAYFFAEKVAVAGGSVASSPADVFYLASYPLALVGVLGMRRWRSEAEERAAFWLDAAMVTLGSAMIAWQVFVRPTLAGAREMEMLTAVAYVVGDLGLLVVLGIGSLRASGQPGPRVALLGVGLAVRLAANALYWYDVLLGPVSGLAGLGAAAIFNLAWLAFALAATVQVRDSSPQASVVEVPLRAAGVSLLPTLVAAGGYVVLTQAFVSRLSLDMAILVAASLALTAAVLARQLVALRSSARLAAERALRANEARFRSLVQNASDIVLVIGEAGEIRYHTPSAERFVRSGESGLDGSPLREVVHPEDRILAQGLIRDAVDNPGTTPSAEWRLRWSDGSWHYVEARAKCVPEDPNLGGVILTLRSVHEHKVLEERLAYQAFHDPLTHLANRMLLSERLEHALVRARRGGQPVSVLFIDLDDFKNVNDSFGHATGDQLLIELSRRLLSCVRASDTAARLGGDEFAVLVEERGGLAAAQQVAARVAEAVARPFDVAGREIVLGASVGIASSEGAAESAGDLLRNADVAMYRAKHAGKRQVVVFEASMQTAVRERLELEAELRGVLERGELRLVYQPIVALASGRIVGAEALMRWDHPVRGRLRPADFFAAAEAAGVMAEIGCWTVEDACRRASGWPVVDEAGQLPLLCVNVAPQLLGTREFVERVEQAVAVAKLPAGRLVLELTEGAAVEDAPATFAAMRRLRAMGVRVAIDDFGTGYSSLSYLRDMPVDILKLDKLFVDGVASDGNAQMLARGILDLGRALGKLVVAEGIEHEAQAERLRAMGCTLGQGFHFSQPLEADRMLERLRAEAGSAS